MGDTAQARIEGSDQPGIFSQCRRMNLFAESRRSEHFEMAAFVLIKHSVFHRQKFIEKGPDQALFRGFDQIIVAVEFDQVHFRMIYPQIFRLMAVAERTNFATGQFFMVCDLTVSGNIEETRLHHIYRPGKMHPKRQVCGQKQPGVKISESFFYDPECIGTVDHQKFHPITGLFGP